MSITTTLLVPHPARRGLRWSSLALLVAGAVLPGLVLGAALAVAVWMVLRTRPVRWGMAAVSAWLFSAHLSAVLWAWPERILAGALLPASLRLTAGHSLWASVAAEALAGPVLVPVAVWLHDRRKDRSGPPVAMVTAAPGQAVAPMPFGTIRGTGQPFGLHPDELAAHVFVIGAPGVGKTITLCGLIDLVLTHGWTVFVLDCKGGTLREYARRLAATHGVSFLVVDPDDPQSLGYDLCAGDPASVANKLVGAFSYGDKAEVYKDIALGVVPCLVGALQAAGERVTLDALATVLTKAEMLKLGVRAGEPYKRELARLAPQKSLRESAYDGFSARLDALRHGTFGPLFARVPALNVDAALANPGVIYISLSATAASEDVELVGRCFAQDLKQTCARRFEQLRRQEAATAAGQPIADADEVSDRRRHERPHD